jgi:hypothetical protein
MSRRIITMISMCDYVDARKLARQLNLLDETNALIEQHKRDHMGQVRRNIRAAHCYLHHGGSR